MRAPTLWTTVLLASACGGGAADIAPEPDGARKVGAAVEPAVDAETGDRPEPNPEEEEQGAKPPGAKSGPARADRRVVPKEGPDEIQLTLPPGRRVSITAEKVHEKNETSLLVRDASAPPDAPPTKMRTTSGEVDSLSADFDGETLWVAWRSRTDDARAIVAVAGFDPGLEIVAEPKILRSFEQTDPVADGLDAIALSSGGAAIVALTGDQSCKGQIAPGNSSCARMQIDILDSRGATVRSEKRLLDGGEPAIDDLLEVGSGVVTAFHVWHGGPLTDVAYVPLDKATEPIALSSCGYPPVDLAFVGDSVLSLCPDPDSEPGVPEPGCKAEKGTCGMLARSGLDGTKIGEEIEVALESVRTVCDGDGAPTVLFKAGAAETRVPGPMVGVFAEQACGGG